MNAIRRMKMPRKKMMKISYLLITMCLLLCPLAVKAGADGCRANVTYEGKGAGQVVFDGMRHSAKGISCSVCHDDQGLFSSALFEKKKGANVISMRKMQLGSSCGYCHDGKQAFSTTDNLHCANCHRKS